MTKKKEKYADKPSDALVKDLANFKKELFNLRFQKALGELKNTARFAVVRKEIARIKTILTQQENISGGK